MLGAHQRHAKPNIKFARPNSVVYCTLQGLELAVPGTYLSGEPVVTIAAFAPQLHVITSKQRPRKLTIHGSDGAEYVFLLKVGSTQHCIFCTTASINMLLLLLPLAVR